MSSITTNTSIAFIPKYKGVEVGIQTPRLSITSIDQVHLSSYKELFSNKEVRQRFSARKFDLEASVETRVNNWIRRWERGNPFSCMSVLEKGTAKFIGYIALGCVSRDNGESELVYLAMPDYWAGYEEEMVSAVVGPYVQELIKGQWCKDEAGFQSIRATVLCTNEQSIFLFQKLGMNQLPQEDELPFVHYTMRV